METTAAFKFKTNLWRRIFATVIDYGLYLTFFCFYVEYFGHDNDTGGKTVEGLPALPVFLCWFVYFILIEGLAGATLGHMVLKLQVVTLDRRRIGLKEALKRHLLDFIDILFYGIPAIIAIKNSDKHQRIGDMWAKTIVVDKTDPEQYIQKT